MVIQIFFFFLLKMNYSDGSISMCNQMDGREGIAFELKSRILWLHETVNFFSMKKKK